MSLKCITCGKSFPTQRALTDHYYEGHTKRASENDSHIDSISEIGMSVRVQSQEPTHHCVECDRQFVQDRTSGMLYEHVGDGGSATKTVAKSNNDILNTVDRKIAAFQAAAKNYYTSNTKFIALKNPKDKGTNMFVVAKKERDDALNNMETMAQELITFVNTHGLKDKLNESSKILIASATTILTVKDKQNSSAPEIGVHK